MSVTYVSVELRRLVAARAGNLCEYCLIHEEDTFFGCEVDHIISEKHGGVTASENLAYSCLLCNRNKGSDIASIAPDTGALVRLFNPRTDCWRDHFRLDREDGMTIVPLTDVGQVTTRLLGVNHADRLLERQALLLVGRYPTSAARRQLGEDA